MLSLACVAVPLFLAWSLTGGCAAQPEWTPLWPEARDMGLPLAGMVRVPSWMEIPPQEAGARRAVEEAFRRSGARSEHLRWRELGSEGLPGTVLVVHAETRTDGRRTEVALLVRRASWEVEEFSRHDEEAHRAWVLGWLHPESGVHRRVAWASPRPPPPTLLALTVEHWTVRAEAVVDRWAETLTTEAWSWERLDGYAEALLRDLERFGVSTSVSEGRRLMWLDAWISEGQAALSHALWPAPPLADGQPAPLTLLPVPLLPASALGAAVLMVHEALRADEGWVWVDAAEGRATAFALRWGDEGVVRPVDFLRTASQIPHAAPATAWVSGVRSVLP